MPSEKNEGRDSPLSTSVEAQAVRVLSRHTVAIPSFDGRWLIGIVVSVPVLVGAGVYWLHQQPSGTASRTNGPMVEVRLFQEAPPAPEPVIALRPTQELSSLQTDPLMEAPERAIPKDTAPVMPAPGERPAASTPSQPPSSSALRTAVPSGTATAFQRVLVSHIARYRRYPPGARGQMSGIVQVMFAMRRDGTVTETWVRTSSGDWLLDQAATETVLRAQPLPTIPPDMPDTLTVLLPVAFDGR